MAAWKKILVGVDGSPSSRLALRWAYDAALQHQRELIVLMAWRPSVPPPAGSSTTYEIRDDSTPAEVATSRLLEVIREELGDDPAVLVRPEIKEGNAASVLIDASADVDLLVIGSRGHGGFVGMLLGSVSQHVTAHAKCTVVVVR